MLARIWDQVVGLRTDIRMLVNLVEVLLDRITEAEALKTREACRYAQCSDATLAVWRKGGLLRGENGWWNRRDLQTIRRAQVLKDISMPREGRGTKDGGG